MFPSAKLILSLALSLLVSLPCSSSSDTPTAYEVLESYDFPVGILPKGVTGYELNNQTGEFKVYIGQTCKYHVDSYELEYKSTITGVISKDRLNKLSGVSVKVLFLWLSIVEVTRDGDKLSFSVGIASANFPLNGFDESPTCRCGFDCNDVGKNMVGGMVVAEEKGQLFSAS